MIDLTLEMIFVLITVAIMMVGLVLELARPDLIIFATLTIFLLFGILTPEEALHGFSNQGMLTIALLFIIAGSVQKSGIVDQAVVRLLNSKQAIPKVMLKIFIPISSFSAFLNNTPIVVTFTPVIRKWCAEHGISHSKFLIPLSYATILGGTITLMGTSTNLVVHGLMLDYGYEGFSIFQLAVVGIPIALLGILYLVTIGYKLLPNHKANDETAQEQSREYLSEVVVEPSYPYINDSVKDAGLRHLKGLFLISIIRGKEKIAPVKDSTKIQKGDRLIFTGLISTIAELQSRKGLKIETGTDLTLDTIKNGNTQLVEAIVSHQSPLLYKTIKQSKFRGKYDAAVIAVHRNQERVKSKVGDIQLKPGDTLLLLTGPDFKNRMNSNDFYVLTQLNNPSFERDAKQGFLSIGILLAMILLVTFNVLTMFKAMSLAVILLLLFRLVTPEEAKNHVQFNVLLLIASAFGIGTALLKTGAAEWIASGLVTVAKPIGIIAVLFLIYVLTNIFTEIITNSAAAVMMFPIAMEVAEQMEVDTMAFAVLVAIAASSSFATPIGYQTNLIVYGPGGYRFTDYMKVGIPLSFIVMITTVLIVNFIWVA